MIRTFLDSGVLIAAARGKRTISNVAMQIFDDPERVYLSSDFVKLEVLPKAIYHKNTEEASFYLAFFDCVNYWAKINAALIRRTHEVAGRYGLSAMDALHLAAAISLKADEFVTCEKPGKPLFRASDEIRVSTIHR
jgi:predicted nucleic acid-binding protein